MGSSPERLEQEIEDSRERLAETVGEIGDRLEAKKESLRPANLARNPKVRVFGGVLAGFYVLRALVRRRRNRRHRED